MMRYFVGFEEGWDIIQMGVTKLKNILEGLPEPQFTSEDYMRIYTTIYLMCTQKPPHNYSEQLYDNYQESIEEYITSTVLPSLREKHDELILRELVKSYKVTSTTERSWSDMLSGPGVPGGKWISKGCCYISEREGEQIDQALLKNVLDIFVEIGMGQMDYYDNDFEAAMLKDTAAYYSGKASNWILDDSYPDYMLKVEECLKLEKDRVSLYLHSSSETKLLEVEDLSRMYRLFSKVPQGLELVANIFKQHVITEGTALVKQAEDAASNKKIFVSNVIELHHKCVAYENDCFQNHALFQKALREAFAVFYNMGVAGSSSEEIVATFCDNILKKGWE